MEKLQIYILIYDENPNIKNFFKEIDWQDLEKEGFTIVSTSDLVGRTMNLPQDVISDNYHPSEKAWDIITPAFVRKVLNEPNNKN